MMKTSFFRKGQPHFQPIGACFSVTTLVHDAVPAALLKKLRYKRETALETAYLKEEASEEIAKIYREYEYEQELLLNAKHEQELPFLNDIAARILMGQIHRYNGLYYDLLAVCVMPNHLHLLLDFSIQIPSE